MVMSCLVMFFCAFKCRLLCHLPNAGNVLTKLSSVMNHTQASESSETRERTVPVDLSYLVAVRQVTFIDAIYYISTIVCSRSH